MNKTLILFCFGIIFALSMARESYSRPAIGGGDHDIIAFKIGKMKNYLNEKSLNQLKTEALKMEEYVNKKSGHMILGGLHDYIESLNKQELVQVMSKMMINNLELLDVVVYESVISPEHQALSFLAEVPQKVGGLHDYIYTIDEETLRTWAIAVDRYHSEKNGGKLIGGGIHDRLRTMKKLDFIEYILKMIRQYPNLDSSIELNQLCATYGISRTEKKEEKPVEEENHTFVGGLVDYIWRQSDETLIQWALTADKYDKEKRNVHLLGGLEDYVNSLSREKLMEIILKHAKTYPELNSNVKLNTLATSYGFVQPEKKKVENAGGLEDYVWRMPDETLRDWALTCEKYHRETKKIQLDGGLHDYINVLNKEQIVEIIMKYVKTYPELNSGVKLTELSIKYGFTPNEGTQKPPEPVAVGGLHDYIWQVRDDILFSWALTCDKYDRQVRNVKLLGGLVDYVRLLKKEELINIVLDFVGKYPELNSAAKLQELAKSYGINAPEN